jgi:hypothetical protein
MNPGTPVIGSRRLTKKQINYDSSLFDGKGGTYFCEDEEGSHTWAGGIPGPGSSKVAGK